MILQILSVIQFTRSQSNQGQLDDSISAPDQ